MSADQPLTGDELATIKTRAERATPGPWPDPLLNVVAADEAGAGGWWIGYDDMGPYEGVPQWSTVVADAEHIAGMDPATTLRLVAEIERLQALEDSLVQEADYDCIDGGKVSHHHIQKRRRVTPWVEVNPVRVP